jgi:hypothetical protein
MAGASPSYDPSYDPADPAEYDPVKHRKPPEDLLERRGYDPAAETSGSPIGWRTFAAPLVVGLGVAILAFSAFGLFFHEADAKEVGHAFGMASGVCWIAAGIAMWRRQLVLTLVATAAALVTAVFAQTLVW